MPPAQLRTGHDRLRSHALRSAAGFPPASPPPDPAAASACGAALRAAAASDPRQLPSAPKGLPSASGPSADSRCAATGPSLRQKVLSLFPVPADLTPFGLPVLGRYVRLRDRKTRGRFARPREHHFSSGPSADRRYAMTASALRPFFPLPAPGATSLRSDAPDRGFNAVGVATARPSGRSARLLIGAARQQPDSSFVGDRLPRAIIFFPRRGDTCVTPRLGGRRDSPSAILRT